MKISVKSLEKMKACSEGIRLFESVYGSSEVGAVEALLEVAKEEPKYSVWWLTKTFTKPENVELVIFTARMGLPIFEEEIPKDDRPRKAIEAAEKWLDNPTEEKELTAYRAASSSAYAAAYVAASSSPSAYTETYNKIISKGIEILERRGEQE